jgi:LPS-assembly protein
MKNKIYKYLFIVVINFLNLQTTLSEEIEFKSKNIEIRNDGNLFIGNGNVEVITEKNLLIYSDKAEFNKADEKVYLFENTKIFQTNQNIVITGNKFVYDKKLEILYSSDETIIEINNRYLIKTSNIEYFILDSLIRSPDHTTVTDNVSNKFEASSFNINLDTKILKSPKIKLTDSNQNILKAKQSIIDLGNSKILSKNPEIYFAKNNQFGDHARLKGNAVTKVNENTEITKGIFTTCKPNNNCPPWSMKSEKIIHDKKNKTINYDNATLMLYDTPVFYFPKFFHPDPTVKRQSGFLIPSFSNSSSSGNSLKIPYFHVISGNKDFTLSPSFFANKDFLMQNEYRQIEKNINHITDFSIKKLANSSKNHFFSNTFINFDNEYFNIFDQSNLELNIETTSNDTYLKKDNIKSEVTKNQTLLNSFIKFQGNNDNLEVDVEISAFEDLSKEKKSDKFQYILPSFNISKNIPLDNQFDGSLLFKSSGLSKKKDTNVSENYFINDLILKSKNYISKNGFIRQFGFNFKNASKKGKNSESYSDNFDSDNFIQAESLISLPLKKDGFDFNSTLSPKALLLLSPFKSENISKIDHNLNNSNLFSSNRVGQIDSLEGGNSLTLGFDYSVSSKDEREIFSSNLGQIFRNSDDKKLPIRTSMNNKSSDIIGNIKISPNNNISLDYDFSADNNLDTINYNFLSAKVSVNNFITTFEYLEENNNVGSESYFSRKISYDLNSNNLISFNTRRNRKRDLTEFYNLIYEYKNDCLVAAIEYNKNYYNDRDIKPNEEIFFSLTITPFTSINSPKFK